MAPAMPPSGGHGAELDQALPLARNLLAEPRRATGVPGPDAHGVGDVGRERRIAQGQQERERDEAAAAGHPVEDPGAHTPEDQQDDVRRAQ